MQGAAGAAKNLFPFSCGRVPTGHLLTCAAKGDRLAGPSSLVSGVLTASFDATTRQQRKERKRVSGRQERKTLAMFSESPGWSLPDLPLQDKPEMTS